MQLRCEREVSCVWLFDLDQMTDTVEHAADLRTVRDLNRVTDPAQAKRAEGCDLRLVRTVA